MVEIAAIEGDHEAFGRRLDDLLTEHSAAQGHPFDNAPVALEARVDGAFAGGIAGYVLFRWCFVRCLAVAPGHRGQGIGARLLAALEAELRTRGALGMMLDTYGFQAPAFYRRHGFLEYGRLEGETARLDRSYMMKLLQPGETA